MNELNVSIMGQDDFFMQEAYKVLRTNILFCGQDIKAIAITSTLENEGKSTIVLGLAQSFAELGKRVLVIDADMRKSVMAARNTDIKGAVGLSEVLSGMANLGEGLYQTQIPQLCLMLAGKYPPNPSELLAGRYFDMLLKAVSATFDYVLIDTPPLGEVIDSAIISAKCDGTVIVCADKVRSGRLGAVIEQLKKGDCKILGIVMNEIREKKSDSHYQKGYAYGYRS